jgi:hypothetical protein
VTCGFCPTCLAAEHASDESLASLVRYQAVQLDKARDALFPTQVALGQAKDRIRELEDIVAKLQRKVMQQNRRAG